MVSILSDHFWAVFLLWVLYMPAAAVRHTDLRHPIPSKELTVPASAVQAFGYINLVWLHVLCITRHELCNLWLLTLSILVGQARCAKLKVDDQSFLTWGSVQKFKPLHATHSTQWVLLGYIEQLLQYWWQITDWGCLCRFRSRNVLSLISL